MQLPLSQPASQQDTRWKSLIDPVLGNQLINGLLLTDVLLANGVTIINTTLGRQQQGYIIVDQNAQARIYRSLPMNAKTLTLTSDAAVTVSLWIF